MENSMYPTKENPVRIPPNKRVNKETLFLVLANNTLDDKELDWYWTAYGRKLFPSATTKDLFENTDKITEKVEEARKSRKKIKEYKKELRRKVLAGEVKVGHFERVDLGLEKHEEYSMGIQDIILEERDKFTRINEAKYGKK